MAILKKSNKKEEVLSKIDIKINTEDWNGNKEEVVTVFDGKNKMKFSLSRFKSVYGDYLLNK